MDLKLSIIVHNLSEANKQMLLPLLIDKLPDETGIVISSDIDWAKSFNNAYWFTEDTLDFVSPDRQFKIEDGKSIAQSCHSLFADLLNSMT
jgi:hypothetical protein